MEKFTSWVSLDMLGELQHNGLKTIIVIHEMGFAKNACEKVIFLADNRIIESRKSAKLFQEPESKALKGFWIRFLSGKCDE